MSEGEEEGKDKGEAKARRGENESDNLGHVTVLLSCDPKPVGRTARVIYFSFATFVSFRFDQAGSSAAPGPGIFWPHIFLSGAKFPQRDADITGD